MHAPIRIGWETGGSYGQTVTLYYCLSIRFTWAHSFWEWLCSWWAALFAPRPAQASPAAQGTPFVYVAPFKLAITPISAQYYERIIHTAEQDGAAAVVFEIDTPGGLVSSMQEMVQTILASRVPVMAYMSPAGRYVRLRGRLHHVRVPCVGDGPQHHHRFCRSDPERGQHTSGTP